jgi:glycyl-tRNA synthetase
MGSILFEMAITIDEMATFCKKKGFVYQNSEIYGGMTGFFDYGHLGVEMKNNLKSSWWKTFVSQREDVVGIDGSIIAHPKVWVASGHVGCFADLMLTCSKCKEKIRADHFIEDSLKQAADGIKAPEVNKLVKENKLKCAKCGGEFAETQDFNLMFKTFVGPKEDETAVAYLRPETAQLMFTNFRLVQENARLKLPFGIAQMGRAFRNEISPRNFLFRCREFEQMEIEYFIHPDKLMSCP